MRSFDETTTIEELYDASDYLEWLAAQEGDIDEFVEHWDRVLREVENEAYMNRLKHELLPY